MSELSFTSTQHMAMRVANALVRAIEEHGAPNSFAFSELVGAKNAMWAGRAVRREWGAFCMNVRTRTGIHINLSGGRLHATPVGNK